MRNSHLLAAASLFSLVGLAACGGTEASDGKTDLSGVSEATDRAASLALACAGCHSANSTAFVPLAGYGTENLKASLLRYQAEEESTTVMHRLVRGYSDADIDLLAAHFGEDGDNP